VDNHVCVKSEDGLIVVENMYNGLNQVVVCTCMDVYVYTCMYDMYVVCIIALCGYFM
jgi:hypothetical protein